MRFVDELRVVKKAVKDAGSKVLQVYSEDFQVEYKGENNPVTRADLDSQEILLASLSEFGYGVLSEETTDDAQRFNFEKVWIIDPLDGTKDFINRTGEFSIMVGLVEKGRPVLGVVYQPVAKRLFWAVKGEGAFLEVENKVQKLTVSSIDNFMGARLLVSRNHMLPLEQEFAQHTGIVNLVPCGSAGIKGCVVALGDADLYLNTSDKTCEWDVCAIDAILSEAGGKLTDGFGNDFNYNRVNIRNPDGFIVSNGVLHTQCVKTLSLLRLN